MIERLQIRNFRAHERLNIIFSPLVNCIIGRNAVGKSTIIRAIRWVVRNKPPGDSVINWDADKASVRLTIDENKITRTRGKGTNTYRLNKNKPYKAFRSDIPTDIEKVMNLSDINFQGQHEAPFWFCKTAGEVSRQLNAIVNLEVIDTTLSNITSALNETQTIIKITKDRLGVATTKQDSLAYIEQMNEDLGRVEILQKQHQEKTTEWSLLQEILELGNKHIEDRNNARELKRASRLALNKGLQYQKITVSVRTLSDTVKSGMVLQKVIKTKPPSLNHLESIRERIGGINHLFLHLKSLVKEAKDYKETKCQTEEELKRCKKELDKVAGGYCPLYPCKTVLKK